MYLNKKWTKFDLTLVIGVIFSVINLILGWQDGEFLVKGLTFSKNSNPTAFWLVFFLISCIAIVFCFLLLTKDFSELFQEKSDL